MDPFCQIIAGDTDAEVIVTADTVIAFLDAHPLFPGHTLVCPVAHHENLYDLPDDLASEIMATARTIALAQRGCWAPRARSG